MCIWGTSCFLALVLWKLANALVRAISSMKVEISKSRNFTLWNLVREHCLKRNTKICLVHHRLSLLWVLFKIHFFSFLCLFLSSQSNQHFPKPWGQERSWFGLKYKMYRHTHIYTKKQGNRSYILEKLLDWSPAMKKQFVSSLIDWKYSLSQHCTFMPKSNEQGVNLGSFCLRNIEIRCLCKRPGGKDTALYLILLFKVVLAGMLANSCQFSPIQQA